MIDLDILEKCGCSAEAWRKLFEDKGRSKDYKEPEAISTLKNRFRARTQGGVDFNLTNHSFYHALDLAWDSTFQQITPTLLSSLQDKPVDGEGVQDTLKSWGIDLSDCVQEVPDPKTPGKTIRKINVPALTKIVPGIGKAYLTMRWAKIVNDRRLVPYFDYVPSISDAMSRMRSEALNHRVETMNHQINYFETERSAIWRALHYSECLAFPVESWYREEQILPADSAEGEDFVVKGKKIGKRVLVKEGIRHHLPHPSRTFYDRAHAPSTFNTSTGATYAGYWRIVTMGDIADNKTLYNTDTISIGTMDWTTGNAHAYLVNVSKGCVANFPVPDPARDGTSKYDSEKHVGNQFYNRDLKDKSVLMTEYFEKLIPSENGLGSYDCPIWCRFVLASDNTVMFAEPFAYDPIIYYGYDNPGGRTLNASMTLEIMPFQDQLGNLLTQFLLGIRQNLTNLVLYDTDIIGVETQAKIENMGEKWYRKINFLGFSGKKMQKAMTNPTQPIYAQRFPQMDTVSLLTAIKTVLDLLERVLVMSSQELAQSASHEQTREEIKNISSNTSTRLQFTSTQMDIAHEAMKRQIYYGLMAHGAASFYAQLPLSPKLDEAELKKLGFTVESRDPENGRARVRVKKSALMYEVFVSNRDGSDRPSDVDTVKTMLSILQPVISNPAMAQSLAAAVGPDQMIKALNYMGRLAGFPRDFKLTNVLSDQGQQTQVPDQIKQYIDQVATHIETDVKGAMTNMAQGVTQQKQQSDSLAQQLQAIQGAIQTLMMSANHATALPPPNALDTLQPQFATPGPGPQFDPMAQQAGVPAAV